MPLYQHRFNGVTQLGTRWTNTWWSDSAASIAAAQSAAEAWANSFYGDIVALLALNVDVTDVGTGEIDISTGTQLAVANGAVTVSGAGTGAALPTDCAIVVSLRTALANRRGRGRFYLPPFDSGASLGVTGRLATTAQQTIVTALTNAWSGYATTGDPVVYSRTGRTIQDVTTFDVGDLWDTQRGRQDRIPEDRLSAAMP